MVLDQVKCQEKTCEWASEFEQRFKDSKVATPKKENDEGEGEKEGDEGDEGGGEEEVKEEEKEEEKEEVKEEEKEEAKTETTKRKRYLTGVVILTNYASHMRPDSFMWGK